MNEKKLTEALEDRLAELNGEEQELLVQLGSRIFGDMPDELESVCGMPLLEQYRSLVETGKQQETTVQTIRDLYAGLENAKRRRDELKKQAAGLNAQWTDVYSALGRAVYDSYSPVFSAVFGTWYAAITAEKQKKDGAELSAEMMKAGMDSKPFVSRIVSRVRYTSLVNSSAFRENRINSLYVKGGAAVFTAGKDTVFAGAFAVDSGAENSAAHMPGPAADNFATGNSAGAADQRIHDAFAACEVLRGRMAKKTDEQNRAADEIADIQHQMKQLGASGTGDRRIEELHRDLRDTSSRIADVYRETGIRYYRRFYGGEGTLNGDVSVVPEDIAGFLSGLARLARDTASCERRIEIHRLETKIDETRRNIGATNQRISANNARIEQLQDEIRLFSETIARDEAEKEKLAAMKTALEMREAGAVPGIGDDSAAQGTRKRSKKAME